MDKILVTGVSGFLGSTVARHLANTYRVYGTYLDHPVELPSVETVAFDLTQLSKLEKLCKAIQPRAVVHTAALSDPDTCEANHKASLTLNTFASRDLARAASQVNAKMIYVSTDLIFNGTRGDYCEADEPHPLSYYGRTKRLGELEVMNNISNYVILRLALMYGRGSGSRTTFFEWMEQQVSQGKKMRLFTNQFRTPLFVGDAAVAIERMIADRALKGLFHLGGPQRLSRYEFGEIFSRVFDFPRDLLVPSLLEDAPLAASRPKDCSLKSDKAVNALKLTLTNVQDGLNQLRQTPNQHRQT